MRPGDRSGASRMGRSRREGFMYRPFTALQKPPQDGMSQALPSLVRGQRFQRDLLDSQQAVSSCLEDRILAPTDKGFEADGRAPFL